MAGPTIVFDLDGTLIDTAPDLVATLNVILTREGLSPLAYDLARNLVGGGAKAMIARGLEAGGRPCPVRQCPGPLHPGPGRRRAAAARESDETRPRARRADERPGPVQAPLGSSLSEDPRTGELAARPGAATDRRR